MVCSEFIGVCVCCGEEGGKGGSVSFFWWEVEGWRGVGFCWLIFEVCFFCVFWGFLKFFFGEGFLGFVGVLWWGFVAGFVGEERVLFFG